MHLYKCEDCGFVESAGDDSIYAPFDDMECPCGGTMRWAGQDIHGGFVCSSHEAPAMYKKWLESDTVKEKLKTGAYEPLRKSDDMYHRFDGRTLRR